MKNIGAILIFLAILLPLGAHAETVLRVGEDIRVDKDQTVEGDYYVSAGPLGDTTMSGTVQQDMYAFGGSVTTNGSVGGDMTVVAGAAQLHASTTDDVRVLGGEVTIGEHIGGDLFVIAGKLTVLSTAHVDGDILFFGGDAEINGTVGGSVLGTSEHIRIDANVGNDVDVKTIALTLGEKSLIGGNVSYESPDTLVRAQNATIEGEVVHKKMETQPQKEQAREMLIPVFMALFAALSLFLLFKKELQTIAGNAQLYPLKMGLIGFSVVLVAPVISLVLIVTVLGMVVGIVGLALTVLMYACAYALSGVIVGSYLSRLFNKKTQVSLLWIVIGTVAVHAFLLVPGIGIALFGAVFMFSVGAIAHYFYKLFA